jgi:hypothetical protein
MSRMNHWRFMSCIEIVIMIYMQSLSFTRKTHRPNSRSMVDRGRFYKRIRGFNTHRWT